MLFLRGLDTLRSQRMMRYFICCFCSLPFSQHNAHSSWPLSPSSLFITCLPILPPLSFHTEVVSCVQGCQIPFYLLTLYVLWKGKFLKNLFVYLFLLCWVFFPGCGLSPSCSKWWLPFSSFSLQWLLTAQALGAWASVVVYMDLAAPWACGIFLDQVSISVPCIGKQARNHWTIQEV